MQNAIVALLVAAGAALAQSSDDAPKFEASDVHVSAKTATPFIRISPVHAGRYEVKNATMVDLIRLAYGFETDKILGGPNWLEMDRFDVAAKVPSGWNPETQKQMMQALLAERFHLTVHQETKPMPAFALTQGRKPQLKEAAGNENAGCKPENGPVQEGGTRLTLAGVNGMTNLTLGPGMTVQFACRNMTMDGFVANLHTMFGANVSSSPIRNETGLAGAWNFDLKYSITLNGMLGGGAAEKISLPEAIDKQLGLKLEEKQVPTPVLVVDKANRKPTPNAPDLAEILPPVAVPTEFEVASIKPTETEGPGPRPGRMQMQPGNRVTIDNMPLRFLINRAFNTNNNDYIVGIPKFAETDHYDITAKAPPVGGSTQIDIDQLSVLLCSLLVDRFKMKYHTEDRPVTAYTLTAAKPKLRKADPETRSWCKTLPTPPGAPPGSRVFSCQNITMEYFAERLQSMSQELNWPVTNSTGLEGNWDLTLTYTMGGPLFGPQRRNGDTAGDAPSAAPSASDPSGGYTLLEAIEKQLGLKLEKQKRNLPVIVIDSMEQKPTEN